MVEQRPGALSGVRVVEIANERTHYCGRLLSGLGADVVLVEPLTGSPTRAALDASGLRDVDYAFAFQNVGKRSIALDLGSSEGGATLERLVRGADIVLTGAVPEVLAEQRLDFETLRSINPSAVVVSITPFGLTGPLANYDVPDLVAVAMGGLLYLGGYADGAPVAPPQSQALFAGGSFAAVAALLALLHAEATGVGQLADVSVQQSVAMALENSIQFWDLEQHVRTRTGGLQKAAGAGLFPTSDGYVYILAGGIGGNRFWPNLVRWMRDAGTEGADLLDGERWDDRDFVATDEAKATFDRVFGSYTRARSKRDVYEASQRFRVPCAPVNTALDVLDDEQLRFRDFFQTIELGDGVTGTAPGAPYRLGHTPWAGGDRVPGHGQHTDEILSELDMAERESTVRA